jgi:hypothetical protein
MLERLGQRTMDINGTLRQCEGEWGSCHRFKYSWMVPSLACGLLQSNVIGARGRGPGRLVETVTVR